MPKVANFQQNQIFYKSTDGYMLREYMYAKSKSGRKVPIFSQDSYTRNWQVFNNLFGYGCNLDVDSNVPIEVINVRSIPSHYAAALWSQTTPYESSYKASDGYVWTHWGDVNILASTNSISNTTPLNSTYIYNGNGYYDKEVNTSIEFEPKVHKEVLSFKIKGAKLVMLYDQERVDDSLAISARIHFSIIADTQSSLIALLELKPRVLISRYITQSTDVKSIKPADTIKFDLVLTGASGNHLPVASGFINTFGVPYYLLNKAYPSKVELNIDGEHYTVNTSAKDTWFYQFNPFVTGNDLTGSTLLDTTVNVYDNLGNLLRRGYVKADVDQYVIDTDSFSSDSEVMIVGQSVKI